MVFISYELTNNLNITTKRTRKEKQTNLEKPPCGHGVDKIAKNG